MGWLDALQGQVIALDTAPLIYYIEENPTYLELVTSFFEAMEDDQFQVVTSYVTLLEVLVHPIRRNDMALAAQYRDILLNARGLSPVPLSAEISEEAARLRAAHNVRTPDAIQIATGIQAGASFFLTNDARLASIPGLDTLTLDRLLLRPTDTELL